MRVVVEVVTDDREDAVKLLRAAASDLKFRKEKPEQQFCMGAYRVSVEDDPDPTIPPTPGHTPAGNCWKGAISDVCALHDEPRGECATCPKCEACARGPMAPAARKARR